MSDFADFKRKSRSSSNLDELSKKIQATSEKKSYKDDRFWRPELDIMVVDFQILNMVVDIKTLNINSDGGTRTPMRLTLDGF